MDVSGEVADLMLKESIEATEKTVRLTASGIKNVAALLIALAKSDRQIIGKTSVKKLTKDPAPAVVLPLKSEDIGRFSKLAKQYGVTYIIARPKGKDGGDVDIISNQNYAPQLNALYQAMGYPLPEQQTQAKEDASKEDNAKKPAPAFHKRNPRQSAGMARKCRRGHLNPPSRRASPLSGGVWPRCKRRPRGWRNPHPSNRKSTHAEKSLLY